MNSSVNVSSTVARVSQSSPLRDAETQRILTADEGNRFWLYVVECAETKNFKIIRIQNPGRLVNQLFYDDGWREVGE
jgi:hypothetical protein